MAANTSLLDLFDDDPMQAALGRLRYLESLPYSGESAERVYRLLVRHAGDLDRLAPRFKDSDAGTGLRAVQAQTFSKAGHLAFYDLGRHTAAQEHLRAGMEAARQSGEPRLRAKLCVNLAHPAFGVPAVSLRGVPCLCVPRHPSTVRRRAPGVPRSSVQTFSVNLLEERPQGPNRVFQLPPQMQYYDHRLARSALCSCHAAWLSQTRVRAAH